MSDNENDDDDIYEQKYQSPPSSPIISSSSRRNNTVEKKTVTKSWIFSSLERFYSALSEYPDIVIFLFITSVFQIAT